MLRINVSNSSNTIAMTGNEEQIQNNASSASRLVIGPPSSEKPDGSIDNKCSFVGSRPAFYASQTMVGSIPRESIHPSSPKRYQGFDRICQSLRHIATSINWGMIGLKSLRPIEVQASIINGKLHISSNFHSEHIQESLHFALTRETDRAIPYPVNIRSRALVEECRNRRHIVKLKKDFLNHERFEVLKQNTVSEIGRGLGCPGENNLSRQEISQQAIAALHILHEVIQAASQSNPSFENLVIHPPFRDASLDGLLPEGVTQTMHAEQNIQSALAEDKDCQYQEIIEKLGMQEGTHVIVPLAGKFVPCAACAEVEHETKEPEGLFDPNSGKFILHRSSQRIGMGFWDEVQHIAVEGLNADREKALAKGIAIRDRFYDKPEKLQAAHREMVEDYSFDTDSACSDDNPII
ncbi:hypothetical protein ALQ62_200128 [Pseudomonas coronafaciens pv. zizaniae]|uniref:hypothetical protein n=1 Tax=Pseudomonas coronafaciens TaxID=53409 RepID=UPI0006E51725|nr:hypothetical protein [Pseudomonas coronafaciens]KPZ22295.1 hypothetical protein ALO38_200218 [Pseudomonas coronafaciens pv. zizaniae]RMN24558.1 hypothetical protein ALQ62_200128 [Pseudomonas coronafaciens pv. zizaniae]